MATVTVNVQANTGDATNDINQLDNALDGAGKSAEELTDSLEGQEKRIKTLSGAINIVGGSVELLAGSLALSGVLTEEQTEKFEGAALGAIAFADGAKRVFEGYKELSEASKLATNAQLANNSAVLANPYVAAAAAIAAVSVALFLLIKRTRTVITEENRREGALNATRKAAEQAAIAQDEFNRALEEEFNASENSIRILKARGASVKEIFQAEKALALLRIESAKALVEEEERQNEELAKIIATNEEVERTTKGVVAGNKELKETYEANKQELSDAKQSLNDLETELKILTIEYTNTTTSTDDNTEALERNAQAAQDTADEQLALADRLDKIYEEQLTAQQRELNAVQDKYFQLFEYYKDDAEIFAFLTETKRKEEEKINKKYDDLYEQSLDKRSKQEKFFASETAEAIGASLNVATDLVSTFSENIDESSEEGFEKSKKYKIAETRIASLQAAFSAYGSVVGVPFVGPVLAVAAAAAALAAGQKAINDIQSSTFDGGGQLPSGFGGAPGGGIPSGQQAGPVINRTIVGGTIEDRPIRAYVVGGDVADELAASEALQRRRALGTG